MGVLYYGPSINKPSHLWMRRMLDGLGADVVLLVDYTEPEPEYRKRFDVLVLGQKKITWPPVLRRLQHYQERRLQTNRLLQAMMRNDVDRALIHYLVYAVKYRDVWHRVTKPVYVHCHGMDVTWELRSNANKWPRKKIYSARYVKLVRNLPENVKFIANSERTRERLTSIGIADDRIYVKYLGVPVSDSPPERNHDEKVLNILYLGRLVDFKGPDLVIEAFIKACGQGLNARLKIAGDGPMFDGCRSLVESSPFAHLIDMVGAVTAQEGERLRLEADIFTAHNRLGPVSGQEEAFGVAFVEAMAAGLPVVTGANGSIPEIIDDGVEGLLCPPGDVDAHARAFLRLYNAPGERIQMGRRGWERAKTHFTIEREIDRLKQILNL